MKHIRKQQQQRIDHVKIEKKCTEITKGPFYKKQQHRDCSLSELHKKLPIQSIQFQWRASNHRTGIVCGVHQAKKGSSFCDI